MRSLFCKTAIVLGALLCSGTLALAQGLGGAGTVQGTVKDPTGGVMPAPGRRQQSRLRLQAGHDHRQPGAVRLQQPAAEPLSRAGQRQGFQALDKDVDVRTAVPIDARQPDARSGGQHRRWTSSGTRRLLERDPTAHTDIDQSLIAKLPLETVRRSESGHHARLARRRRRLERLLPSGRRPRADAVLDRQPAGHRSAEPHLLEPDFAGRRAVDGGHHRCAAGRIRRQEQPRRAHRHQVGARSAEADRQRRRSATVRSAARRSRLNVGGGSHSVGNFLSVSGLQTDRFLDPPEFEALHDTGTACRSSIGWTSTRATSTRST